MALSRRLDAEPSDVTIFSSTDNTPGLPSGTTGESGGPTYDPNTGTSYILNTDIDAALASSNVVINTGSPGDGLGGSGNIHFGNNNSTAGSNAAPIYWTSSNSLTLNAVGVIDTIGGARTAATGTASGAGALAAATAGLLIDAAGGGSFTLNAATGGGLTGSDVITISADIEAHGGTITIASQSEGQSDIRKRDAFFIVEPNQAQLTEISRLIDAGKIRTFVEAVFPLAQIREAYARAAQRKPGRARSSMGQALPLPR